MTDGILAQVVEHLTFNQVVPGSSPGCLMEEKKIMLGDLLFFISNRLRKVPREETRSNKQAAKRIVNISFNLTQALVKDCVSA